MKKMLIVDDHVVTRMGLKTLLNELYMGSEIHEAKDGKEVINLTSKNNYEFITLDINMPDTDTLELIKTINQQQPGVKILVISMNNEEVYGLSAIKSGAKGFVSKENNFETIKSAIQTVMSGRKYIGEKILNILIGGNGMDEPENPFQKLSEKELFIAQLVIDGNTTKEIANRTNLRWSTVSTFKNRIFEKLGVGTAFELLELSKVYNVSRLTNSKTKVD